MNNSLICVRYAKALFSLSKENGEVNDIYNDMNVLSELCNTSEDLKELLISPVVSQSKKKAALNGTFQNYVNKLTLNFLNVMVDNRRESLLPAISRNFIAFYKKDKSLKTVTFYTASKLSETHLEEIKVFLQKELNANIEMTVLVRNNLIGGFILMVDGKMMDASIASKLKKLKMKLLS